MSICAGLEQSRLGKLEVYVSLFVIASNWIVIATRPKSTAISRAERVVLSYVSVGFVYHMFVKLEANPRMEGKSAVFVAHLGGEHESLTKGDI